MSIRLKSALPSSPPSHSKLHLPNLKPLPGHLFATPISAPQRLSSTRNAPANTLNPPPTPSPYSVHIGTKYENLCLDVLRLFGFSLTRTGGKSDKGIDLLGLWRPPLPSPSDHPLRVIVQCKAHSGQVYPALVRELEGAVAGAPGEWRGEDTIAVLCASKGATGGIRNAVRTAERGIVWATVEQGQSEGLGREGRVTQLLWNDRVRKVVKTGLGSGLRYIPGAKGLEQEVVLMLDGQVWEPELAIGKEADEGAEEGETNKSVARSKE